MLDNHTTIECLLEVESDHLWRELAELFEMSGYAESDHGLERTPSTGARSVARSSQHSRIDDQRPEYSRNHSHVDIQSFHQLDPLRWFQKTAVLPKRYISLMLGRNPFKTSYFSLYRPIKDWRSRCILLIAVVCSIAAGIPLPIIGVIFSKIINSFPPAEPALTKSIGELLGVAVAYFVFTWVRKSILRSHSPGLIVLGLGNLLGNHG